MGRKREERTYSEDMQTSEYAAPAPGKLTRTFDAVVYVSGPVSTNVEDWPPQMFDTLMEALEKKAEETRENLTIVRVRVDVDHEKFNPMTQSMGVWFAHIVAISKPKIYLH